MTPLQRISIIIGNLEAVFLGTIRLSGCLTLTPVRRVRLCLILLLCWDRKLAFLHVLAGAKLSPTRIVSQLILVHFLQFED